jgi:hypothetical protein
MTDADPAELGSLPDDPAEARRLVKARLVPEDRITDDLVHRPVLPGIEAVLVFDLPDRLVPVGPANLAALAAAGAAAPADDIGDDVGEPAGDEDALWQEAFDRVAAEDHPEIDVEEFGEGVPLMLLASDSFFCATNALWIERFLDPPPHGLLFAVPHRHVIVVHAVHDQGVALALPNLVLLARHNHAEGEGPISPDVFWWHDGEVSRIDVVETANDEGTELAINLPDELAAVVAELTAIP